MPLLYAGPQRAMTKETKAVFFRGKQTKKRGQLNEKLEISGCVETDSSRYNCGISKKRSPQQIKHLVAHIPHIIHRPHPVGHQGDQVAAGLVLGAGVLLLTIRA